MIKEIDLSDLPPGARREARREADLLGRLSHENVVGHIATFLEEDRLCIVMEYCDGGDLAQVLKQRRGPTVVEFVEDEVLSIFSQCCRGLQHTHQKKILHRDLKCQNIFLTSAGQVKLGDFGIAKVLDHTTAKAGTRIGTPYYVSPEVCDNQPYGFSADVWSLGVILYELLTLQLPFQAPNLVVLVMKILQSEPRPPPERFSEALRILSRQTLDKDPEQRPSIDQMLAAPVIQEALQMLALRPKGHPMLTQDAADEVDALLAEMESGLSRFLPAARTSPGRNRSEDQEQQEQEKEASRFMALHAYENLVLHPSLSTSLLPCEVGSRPGSAPEAWDLSPPRLLRPRRCRHGRARDGVRSPCASPLSSTKFPRDMGLDTMIRLLTAEEQQAPAALPEEDPTSPISLAIQRGLGTFRPEAMEISAKGLLSPSMALKVSDGRLVQNPARSSKSLRQRVISMPQLALWPLEGWSQRPGTAAMVPRAPRSKLLGDGLFGAK